MELSKAEVVELVNLLQIDLERLGKGQYRYLDERARESLLGRLKGELRRMEEKERSQAATGGGDGA